MEKGIVEQLQADALDEKIDIETLLRKAYLVASKLKLDNFKEWILSEQNGYKEKTPYYRIIKGEIKARTHRGKLIPVLFPSNIGDKINTMPINEPIATIVELYRTSNNPIRFSLSSEFNEFMNINTNAYDLPFYFETSTSEMRNILSAVRNAVLEWSLVLESNGIVGDEFSFSNNEIEVARSNQTIYNYTNIFYSSVSNSDINQGSNIEKHDGN